MQSSTLWIAAQQNKNKRLPCVRITTHSVGCCITHRCWKEGWKLPSKQSRGVMRYTLTRIGTTQSHLPCLRRDQIKGTLPFFSTSGIWDDLLPLWSLWFSHTFLRLTFCLLAMYLKDGAQLESCLLQRQPYLMKILLEGDKKLHKWISGPWTKSQMHPGKQLCTLQQGQTMKKGRPPPHHRPSDWGCQVSNWAENGDQPLSCRQTMLRIVDKAIQKTYTAFIPKSEQKHKNSPRLLT